MNRLPWHSAEVLQLVQAAVGPGAELRRFEGPERFDVLPLLVGTDGALELFGRDSRRLRPNIVMSGVEGLNERSWSNAVLRLPHAAIRLEEPRERCVMTTYDPDSGAQDVGVLRDIVRRFGGRLCLNAAVDQPGWISEGDQAELLHIEHSGRQ